MRVHWRFWPAVCQKIAIEESATEVEDGACAQLAPAHPGAFHALLHEMFSGRLHGTRTNGQALLAVGGILHALGVGAEVAAFGVQHLLAFPRSVPGGV